MDKASSMINHIESTIATQSIPVFPVHIVGGPVSPLGDSIWLIQDKIAYKQVDHTTIDVEKKVE